MMNLESEDTVPGSLIASNPYLSLGVRPFINCCGTRTVHGGSLILPEVRAAINAAASQFVNMNELMQRARLRIAELTGAEDGIVTAGSAAAIAIATAAALAGKDPVKMLRLPHTEGLAKQVVMLKSHRFPYDQAIRMVGAEIVEVESLSQLQMLDFDKIAMIVFLGSRDRSAEIAFEELVSVGRQYHVPVLVDAASEHIERPNIWLSRGADLVVYSGGKVLRGPQTSGLLLGRKELIEAAWSNSPPHRAFGRPMKIGKEDVVGVIAALELWFSRDLSAVMQTWMNDVRAIAAEINAAAGMSAEILPPDEGDKVPMLRVNWNYAEKPLHGMELRRRLLAGEPRIMLDDVSAGEGSVVIEVFSLQPGEAKIVGEAIVRCWKAFEADEKPKTGPLNISGEWDFEVKFNRWPRRHAVSLLQHGNSLFGEQQSAGFSGPVIGNVEGDTMDLAFEDSYEGAIITYHFRGIIAGDDIRGEVELGSTTAYTRGEVSYTQYGKEQWQAKRRKALAES
jgi:L-seryl-tRNA(Ser) seleniumtransferase